MVIKILKNKYFTVLSKPAMARATGGSQVQRSMDTRQSLDLQTASNLSRRAGYALRISFSLRRLGALANQRSSGRWETHQSLDLWSASVLSRPTCLEPHHNRQREHITAFGDFLFWFITGFTFGAIYTFVTCIWGFGPLRKLSWGVCGIGSGQRLNDVVRQLSHRLVQPVRPRAYGFGVIVFEYF